MDIFDRALAEARAFKGVQLPASQQDALRSIIAAAQWGRATARGMADAVEDAHRRAKDHGTPVEQKAFIDGVEFLRVRTSELERAYLKSPLGELD